MPDEHVSVLQSMGVVILALAAAVWILGLIGLARRGHFGPVPWPLRTVRALPQQRRSPPPLEYTELTPAEQAAFAGLVRRLSDGR